MWEPVQRHLGATTAVLQALEEVDRDASARSGSQHEGEKMWIRERLARKRSAAAKELLLLQQREGGEGEGQQAPPSIRCYADRTAVRALCVCIYGAFVEILVVDTPNPVRQPVLSNFNSI